jgi:muramoyltetrapeptide carboxypeptidase
VTLLIDPPNSPGHGRLWSHLASDASFEELHLFASTLGIPQRGFDRDHYDIPAERYENVVAAGATPISSRDLIVRLKAAGLRRRKGSLLEPKQAGRSLVRAKRLRNGDKVAVVSPSGPVPDGPLDAGIALLESWGLSVTLMQNARGAHEHLSYLAAVDAARAGDFMRAWVDPAVVAVFAARGGYGAQRMVDLLDWESIAKAGPKVLVGYSDITALHQAFASRLGMSTIHGPVVTSLVAGDEAARAHLHALLFEPQNVTSLTPKAVEALVPGLAEGVLVGGNLALLAAEIGTGNSVSAADSIAVIEDVTEDSYRIDRLLTQLLRAGWFDRVRGIALGQFTDCGEPGEVLSLVKDRLAPLGVPTLWGVPVGHVPGNLAVPFGVRARLDADAGTLELRDVALL